jgi:Bifunctional DNA primase/polymerase, N-terminal.
MEPRPEELQRFVELLTETAPDGYEPHLIALEEGAKGPDLSRGSWKDAGLELEEALTHMGEGGNIGLAAMRDDPLVIVDLDDEEEIIQPDALPHTLMVRSRSRRGIHGFYWGDVPNPTKPGKGEIRAQNQYVVAAGSYVQTQEAEAPDPEDPDLGYYTLLEEADPQPVTQEELPAFFYPDEPQEELPAEVPNSTDEVEPVLKYALGIDEELADLWHAVSSSDGDRSEREFKLAGRLGFYFQNDRRTVARLMDRSRAHKWAQRDDDSYRSSVLEALDGNTDVWEPGQKYADWVRDSQLVNDGTLPAQEEKVDGWDQIRQHGR